jgi:hypothetical protein
MSETALLLDRAFVFSHNWASASTRGEQIEEQCSLHLVQVMAYRGLGPAVEAVAESMFSQKPPTLLAALFMDCATWG